jgi:hypothetical protein
MSELKQRFLKYELGLIGYGDAVYIPESDSIKIQPDDQRKPFINNEGDITYGAEHGLFARNTLRPIVDRVNELVTAWEKAPSAPFESVKNFRLLTEYNDVVLAARDDGEYGRGLYFTTWKYNADRTGFDYGNYMDNFEDAKVNFAIRAGLMPQSKVFTQEQAAKIYEAIYYRLRNEDGLSYKAATYLRRISSQLAEGFNLPIITKAEQEQHHTEPDEHTAQPHLKNVMTESLTEAIVVGQPAMFIPIRIDRNTVPEGYYAYDIRHCDETGDPATIEKRVVANYFGTIITPHEIKLPNDDYLSIDFDDFIYVESDIHFMTEFMEKHPPVTALEQTDTIPYKPKESIGDRLSKAQEKASAQPPPAQGGHTKKRNNPTI